MVVYVVDLQEEGFLDSNPLVIQFHEFCVYV